MKTSKHHITHAELMAFGEMERETGRAEASASATSESAGKPRSLDVATGSLPVSSVDGLLANWYGRAATSENYRRAAVEVGNLPLAGHWQLQAAIYRRVADELQAEMESAKSRQPRENAKCSQPATR